MTTLAGVLRWDRRPHPASDVRRILEALDPGGDIAVWSPAAPDPDGAVGHRSLPHQAPPSAPVHSPDGRVAVVADTRIDNRADLVRALDLGTVIPPPSDADLVLEAYLRWGQQCPIHLVGDFAFVVCDSRDHTMFAARDGMGQRVLFLHHSEARIAFASSPTALVALPDVPVRLDRRAVAQALVLLPEPRTTLFQGIQRLAPGEAVSAGPTGVRRTIFWTPQNVPDVRFRHGAEYVEAFLSVFGEAVRARLPEGDPVGVLLSGGLDSTAVAAMAAEAFAPSGRTLQAYHSAPGASFDGRAGRGWVADETHAVQALTDVLPGLTLHVDRDPHLEEFWEVEDLFRRTGAPIRNPNNWGWFRGQYAVAHRDGVRVMLTGNMGNATISYDGVRVLQEAARRGAWGVFWRHGRALVAATGRSWWSVCRDEVVLPLVPLTIDLAHRKRQGTHDLPLVDRTLSPIRPDQVEALELEEVARSLGRGEHQVRRARGVDLRTLTLRGTGGACEVLDALRSWYGIETRDPTADIRVAAFCLGVPEWQYRSAQGERRWLIRRAMRGRVPDLILDRRTYGAQGADWMDWMPRLRDRIRGALDDCAQSDEARTLLDLKGLRGLVDHWPPRLEPEHEGAYKLRLLRGVMMGRFLRWFERTYG